MKNHQGLVIYVGKAKHLKKRVSSYFNKTHTDFKTIVLVSQICSIETISTHSEHEAFILEAQLIKEYSPKYNILLKDDKSYPYIKITKEPFPKLLVVRQKLNDQASYFGPFPSMGSTRYMRRMLLDLFPIRDCSQPITLSEIQPKCMLLDIQKCIGPCVYKSTQSEYMHYIQDLSLLLSGKNKSVLKRLKETMLRYSDQQLYEKAASVRDTIKKLDMFTQKQDVHLPEEKNSLVIAMRENKTFKYLIIQTYIRGKLLRQKGYYHPVNSVDDESFVEQSLAEYVMEFDPEMSDVLCSEELYHIIHPFIQRYNLPLQCSVPQRGYKLDVLKLADKNAFISMNRLLQVDHWKRKPKQDPLDVLQSLYRLRKRPERIIGIDISHLQSNNIVGSAVYFKQGLPYKAGYRRFSIKGVTGRSNDPLSIKEVVTRRLKRCELDNEPYPDLLLIDGGRGQLNFATQALRELNLLNQIDIISLAKRLEEVYTNDEDKPFLTDLHAPSTKLLQKIRDESHRFALTYQRLKRNNVSKASMLTEIKGVGKTRMNALYQRFGTLDQIVSASVEDISKVSGIGLNLASEIKFFLTSNSDIA